MAVGNLEAELRRHRGRDVSLLYVQPTANPADENAQPQILYPIGRVTDVRVENGNWKVTLRQLNTETEYDGCNVREFDVLPRPKTEIYFRYMRMHTTIGRWLFR